MKPTEQDKLSDEELKKEVLTQICLIKYGNAPSNLSSEQLAQVAFAASDMYQLVTADRKRVALEARIDELEKFVNTTNRSLSVKKLRDRLSALKSQQEEV